jgi:c-di-GMP-binding flagellar brake protein YcgR
LARVVRTQESSDNTVHTIAVWFLDLSGADRARINKFVIERIEETDHSDS